MRIKPPIRRARPIRGGARLSRLVAVLLVGAGLAGCISEGKEQALGDTIAQELNPALPLIHAPELVRYVNGVGQLLAQTSKRPDLPYRFYIINAPEVNAFALPGGHIYVTRGLIHQTGDLSELAGVLAHEIGHVAARHGVQKLERHLRTGSVVSTLYNLFLGGHPSILQHRSLQLGGRLWYLSHSREDELEADRLAVGYLRKSGVDPQGMITMLNGLLEEDRAVPETNSEWFSTHPLTQNRIDHLVEEIGEAKRAKKGRAGGAKTPQKGAGGEEMVRDLPSYQAFLEKIETLPPPPFGMMIPSE